MKKGFANYDKYPEKKLEGFKGCAFSGYEAVSKELCRRAAGKAKCVIVVDLYPGVNAAEVRAGLSGLNAGLVLDAEEAAISNEAYRAFAAPYLTDDRVFGVMNTKTFADVFDAEKEQAMRSRIEQATGLVLLIGVGAARITRGDVLVYADLARWEIQKRFAAGMPNWKAENNDAPKLAKFKQGFFLEWRMADRHKRKLLKGLDYLLDTNEAGAPRMIAGDAFRAGLTAFATQPFRLVPYFAPEVWGGQWMKEVCDLDRSEVNFAWAFDGVPEENSLLINVDGVRVEIPAIDAVFYRPALLLGQRVHARFGDEFPIRFDFLDTMGGQNLSLQVHPLTEYIQHTFNMHYTQDESYYILDCEEGTSVYLGFREGVDKDKVLAELEAAGRGERPFEAEKYVNKFPVKRHDHFLIPAGTIHCSGSDTMVLEISATPYIFTFKLWDWGRVGLDGLPRPTHLKHGREVLQWDRTTRWVEDNLVNRFETLSEADGVKAEHTGLHEREFIETVRYTAAGPVELTSPGSFSMCNLVDGKAALIESPDGAFPPYEVHYAETFILPESVKRCTIRPLDCKEIKVLRAYVRG